MNFYKMFLTNVSILITCAYLFNLGYKYLFQHTSQKVKQSVIIAIFILSGCTAMFFSVRWGGRALFDLRAVPLIFAALVFRDPRPVLIIGLGIALGRYAITGVTPQAVTGSINIMLLGCLSALLVALFGRVNWSYRRRALVSIVSVNSLQVIGIYTFGSLPGYIYLREIMVYTYPLSLILSTFFVFIIRDFYKEQRRVVELRNMNLILRRQTRELREAKRELEERARQLMLASKYKSEFMANMSHELKTPLNSIIILSQMIRENEDAHENADAIRYADIIHTSGNELLQMINDILDLSKVEAGKMDVVLETVVVEDLMQQIHHQFLPMAEQKALTFDITIDEDAPKSITTDALRLSQILRNLLMNAIKFTDKGTVTLKVNLEAVQLPAHKEPPKSAGLRGWKFNWNPGRMQRAVPVAAKRGALKPEPSLFKHAGWIVFSVRDTGLGIEPDKQKLIFEAFQQEDGAINRKYGGTGLGLSISLQLAKLLGGILTLHSVKGEGSNFSLHLPANRQVQGEVQGGAADPHPVEGGETKR